MENSLFQPKKIYLFLIVLTLTATLALVATKDVRATMQMSLEELARIKDGLFPVSARPPGPSRLEELERIKDDVSPVNARFAGAYRLEELERIKDDVLPVNARPSQPKYPDSSTTNH